jgi:hypothetical protein
MKRFLMLVSLFAVGLGNLPSDANAQTAGTLSFSVTTTEPTGNYNNVNVVALWIQDTNGAFIKTKIRYAASRIQYLNKWITASSYNVVDAVTGPTRSSQGTLSFNWNATNVAGVVVNDGYYRVYMQMSDANVAGQWTYVQFKKDTNAQTLSPSNVGNFTNMTLQWTPSPANVEEVGKNLLFNCFPNPAVDIETITYCLEQFSDVTITLHDLAGRNIAVLADGNQSAGAHQLRWDARQIPHLTSGVYFLRINTGYATAVKKMIIR